MCIYYNGVESLYEKEKQKREIDAGRARERRNVFVFPRFATLECTKVVFSVGKGRSDVEKGKREIELILFSSLDRLCK